CARQNSSAGDDVRLRCRGQPHQFCGCNRSRDDYVYDALNRQTKTIFPATVIGGSRTGLTNVYDVLNRRIALTNQAGIATGYGYDSLSQLTSVTNGLGKRTAYGYDVGGNQTSQTDALSRLTSFALDGLGRRTQRTLPLTVSESF